MKNCINVKHASLNLKGLHHIAIICSDYDKSKKFYTEILGFTTLGETFRKERGSYKLDLILGPIRIELFSFPNPPRRITFPEATGLRHIAFVVNKIDKLVKKITLLGVSVEPVRIDLTTGKKFTFLFDPDFLPIEIYEK